LGLSVEVRIVVSDKFKCIFVEVPKTGSTSIRSIIGYAPKPHFNICQIANEIDKERFVSYFKFGFVRNPWDRAVSLYERKEGLQLKSKMSFDQFVEWMKFSSCTCTRALPHRYQLDWFVSPHGDILVDFIGRYESLQSDWAKIAARLNANPHLPKKRVNTERERDYSKYYSDRTKRIIAERFAVDIEYFGYKFGD
jgi:Sulfotransferase family